MEELSCVVVETKASSQIACFNQLTRSCSALMFEPWYPSSIVTFLLGATFSLSNMSGRSSHSSNISLSA